MQTIYVSYTKDVVQIEKRFSEDFENLCDWFVDNKLSTHFGEDKKNLFYLLVNEEQRISLN